MPDPSLDQIERWMMEVITDPDGVESGLKGQPAQAQIAVTTDDLEKVVDRSRSLTSVERLRIYADMYLWRIADILADEYPTVRHIVGPERFYQLATGFIASHPSRHYDLARMSRRFWEYVGHEVTDLDSREFVAEVAQLERSMEDVFDAPRVDPVDVDDLLALPQDRWGETCFTTTPALRLHEFRFPVNQFVQSVRDQKHMNLPALKTTWVAVFRGRDFRAYRAALSREQYLLLRCLEQGQTLAKAIEECAADPAVNAELLLTQLQSWFREWASEGFFVAVCGASPPSPR